MTDAVVERRRVALRLLIMEAGVLGSILGAFAVLSWWLGGGRSNGASLLAGLALLPACLAANWFLVRSGWKRLGQDFGGGPRLP